MMSTTSPFSTFSDDALERFNEPKSFMYIGDLNDGCHGYFSILNLRSIQVTRRDASKVITR